MQTDTSLHTSPEGQSSTLASHPSPLNITILSAGAGSGKTYTLTGRMVEMLERGVRPAGIVATTFTQKAAAELQERVRARLLEAGMLDAANELGSALIGTVHSMGVKLLQRFAFEAGVSPLVEIIADGDEQRLFNESLAEVLSQERIETMNRLADRLGLTKKTLGEPYDWRRDIRNLTDVARANNFSRAILETSKQRSWESFVQLLPPVSPLDALTWQNRLIAHLDQTIAALENNAADETKTTRTAIEELRAQQNQLRWRGELYWHEWVKIGKTSVAVKSRDLLEPLLEFVRGHGAHREFQDDIRRFIFTLFDIAADALDEFEHYKKKRGLIDYTDMECYVSRLLRIPAVRDTLRDELDLLLVDEFQDTSPIQLDIFLQLSRLARHSIWVGDPKQSIYGFRGAEPALMQAIIEATGGVKPENILKKSYRSRADLVDAVNAIFTRAFSDLPEEQIVLEANFSREKEVEMAENQPAENHPPFIIPPALIHWHFRTEDSDTRRAPGQPWMENCIADQIGIMLDRGIPVFSKNRKTTRPVQPGDIAVLCRNNRDCVRVAEALHRAGLQASFSRTGLLDTPEVRLVLACMKYLINPKDLLSAAEIQILSGAKTLEQIVNERLVARHEESNAVEALTIDPPGPTSLPAEALAKAGNFQFPVSTQFVTPLRGGWRKLRAHTADLSASEILNLLLDDLDLRRIVVRLGQPDQRLDNVDRLRRLAADYENACNRLHTAASLGGFLLWLNELQRNGNDQQASGESPQSVKVMTYHKSKGLEFPVAICHNLDAKLKEQVWGINLVSEVDKPDLDNILGNRWLRFWVNPYADQLRGTALDEALRQSQAWTEATRQALAEEARLLYVGLTRARDYLVLPGSVKGTLWLNRVFSNGDESIPTLEPDGSETPFVWGDHVIQCECEPLYKPRDFPEAEPNTDWVTFHAPHPEREPEDQAALAHPCRDINAKTEMPSGLAFTLDEPEAFAAAVAFSGEMTAELEAAVRSLFGADDPALSRDERSALAQRQLFIRRVDEPVEASALAQQSAAFHAWMREAFLPVAVQARYPLEGWYAQRHVQVKADFFLENEEEVAVLLFAPYAEGMKKWKPQAQSVLPPLAWIDLLLERAFPGKRRHFALVFPLEGQVLRVQRKQEDKRNEPNTLFFGEFRSERVEHE